MQPGCSSGRIDACPKVVFDTAVEERLAEMPQGARVARDGPRPMRGNILSRRAPPFHGDLAAKAMDTLQVGG